MTTDPIPGLKLLGQQAAFTEQRPVDVFALGIEIVPRGALGDFAALVTAAELEPTVTIGACFVDRGFIFTDHRAKEAIRVIYFVIARHITPYSASA